VLDLSLAKVAHTDRLDLAFLVCLLQWLPHTLDGFWPSVWAMDEEKIHVAVRAARYLLDAVCDAAIGAVKVLSCRQNLGGEEDIGAGYFRLDEGFADLFFIGVVLCTVDVPVYGSVSVASS